LGTAIFLVLAGILNLAAFIWLVVTGFKRSVLWGILIFFLSPLTAIIFAVTNWYDAKKPFLAYILTSVLFLIPFFSLTSQYDEEFAQRLAEKVESGEIPQNEVGKYLQDPSLLDELDEKQADMDGTVVLDQDGNPVVIMPDPSDTSADQSATGDAAGQQVETDTAKASGKPVDEKAASEQQEQAEEGVEEEWSEHPKPGQAKPDPLQIKKKTPEPESVRVSLNKISGYKGRYFIVTTKSGSEHRGILVKVTTSRIELERKIYGGTFTYRILKKNIKRIDMLKKEYVEERS
jgi:hypothetical protein